MTDTVTGTAPATCRLTGRVLDATARPTPGAVITLTPLPPLPAAPGQPPALITPARLDLDEDGRITSPDPATGLTRPWAEVVTGEWTTRVRLTGTPATWAVDTHLPPGGSVDITTLTPTHTPPTDTPPQPPHWATQLRTDLDTLTTRIDAITTEVGQQLTDVMDAIGQASLQATAATNRIDILEKDTIQQIDEAIASLVTGPYQVWTPGQTDPDLGAGDTTARQMGLTEAITTLAQYLRDIGGPIRSLAGAVADEHVSSISQALIDVMTRLDTLEKTTT
nr:hypothetical protein [Actinomyces sp.]